MPNQPNEERYEIRIEKNPRKYIERLPKHLARRVVTAIDALAINPYPTNSLKLEGYDDHYRLRLGDLRVVYAVFEDRVLIVVIEVAPRGSAYRNL
jgi:mRNA interferase RelE/StbE